MVSVLFARADSNYKTLPGVDVWDAGRDARAWPGGNPVVAHPPCRAWGRLRHFAKPQKGERALAIFAVRQVRRFGGVLEHPLSSRLWARAGLPLPGQHDRFGGFTVRVDQYWWGHLAQKPTWLYICGCEKKDVPQMPLQLGQSECVIRLDKRRPDGSHIRKGDSDWRRPLNSAEREHTPIDFAVWLVKLAARCIITPLNAAIA